LNHLSQIIRRATSLWRPRAKTSFKVVISMRVYLKFLTNKQTKLN